MDRIISLLLVLLMCFSSIGAARPGPKTALPTVSQGDIALASLKRNGTEVTSVSALSLYDVVTFGRYPQSADGRSADIEWIVVGYDGSDRVKLLSRYCLDMRPYNGDTLKVSWTSTTLYTWLNSTFKASAFSSAEQDQLALITIPTVSEAQDLPLAYRCGVNTAYAISQGADPINCIWWLSDQGVRIEGTDNKGEKVYRFCASAVQGNGNIMAGGFSANFNGKSVRPLITVDLNADAAAQRASSPLRRRGAAVRSVSELDLYDTVTFGSYTQSLYGDATEIEWLVAGFEGNKVKLISKYGLDQKRYNETNSTVSWTNSSLYSWLNNSFKYSAFTGDERTIMADDVTLPSVTEAQSLPRTWQICTPTAYAISNGVSPHHCIWWLREPTRYIANVNAWCASGMLEDYRIFEAGYIVTNASKAVRPMITLDLSKLPN